ncbi:MAG: hypothetical protein CMM56_00835 [Rhodospirillaceae bacterium]|nr:hypothetical protein [Rhodospirillaceae bacterium]
MLIPSQFRLINEAVSRSIVCLVGFDIARVTKSSQNRGIFMLPTTLRFKLAGGALGAKLLDFDAKKLHTDAEYEALLQALAKHCVLILSNQNLTDLDVVNFLDRFSTTFEQWSITPDFLSLETKKAYVLSSKKNLSRYAGSAWHADYAFDPKPADISAIYMRTIPTIGGDTGFCNMYAAYDKLSEAMKEYVDGLTALFDNSIRGNLQHNGYTVSQSQLAQIPPTRHPIVVTHPLTKGKSLYVSEALVDTILELPKRESDSLVRFLHEHINQLKFQYRHQWHPNDLVLIDNRCTSHCAIADYDMGELREGIVVCARTEPSCFSL